MKITIQGHLDRGNEVIQILESLGGINRMSHTGCCDEYFYYISVDGNTIVWTSVRPIHLSVFTLEEFETQFPFKVGDKIKHITSIGVIKEYCYIDNEPAYKVESMELGIIATIPAKLLEPYKEMEIRNITLTLEKAKEWYKKGGDLKQVALQAFTEEELTKVELPKTWKEFCKNYPVKEGECWLRSGDVIDEAERNEERKYKNWIPSKKSAEAHLAMIQLEQLRNCWWGDWRPEWNISPKYAIKNLQGEINILGHSTVAAFLVFPTREIAEKFLKCFRDLIEKAGDLI